MEQIADAMDNIQKATSQSASAADSVEGAAEILNRLSRQLRDLVEQYQL
jgi:methyl-accepting chemotaxis protein